MAKMNKQANAYIALLVCIAAIALGGCAKRPTEDDKILAKVSNKFIRLRDLKQRIAKLPTYYQELVERNKKKYLDETIVETMFYEEAIRRGLDRDLEVRDVIREAKKKIMIAKLIKLDVEDKIKVDDKEARQYYETNKDEFKAPEMWRASHVLVGSEAEAQEVVNALSSGGRFEDIAKARSTDATATRGGDVGFFRLGQVVPEFEDASLKLDIGQTSPIVRSQFGYHVIKLTDKRAPAVEPYEKVRGKIEDLIAKKKRSERFDQLVLELKNKYSVQIEDDVFKSLDMINDGERKDILR